MSNPFFTESEGPGAVNDQIATALNTLNAGNLTTGTVPAARLGSSGTRDNTHYLRGDNAWAVPPGGGTPDDNSVSTAKIQDGAVTAAKLDAAAVNPAPTVLAYGSGTVSPVGGQYNSIAMSGALTINPPSAPVDGMKWKARLAVSGGDQNLTLDAAIHVPSLSTFTSPHVLPNGKTALIQLEYVGTYWLLESLLY